MPGPLSSEFAVSPSVGPYGWSEKGGLGWCGVCEASGFEVNAEGGGSLARMRDHRRYWLGFPPETRPLLWCHHDDVLAATPTAEQRAEQAPGPVLLDDCFGELFADCSSDVGVGADLDGDVGYACDVADVVYAAGAELAACGYSEMVAEESLDFELGAVAFAFRGVGHAAPLKMSSHSPGGRVVCWLLLRGVAWPLPLQ